MALLQRAAIVLSPDSGPVHIANALGTKVVGLYACTDATRSGPYSDLRFSTNHYDAAARQFLGKPASALRWGKRIEFPGVMDLIGVDEVIDCVDRCTAALRTPQPDAPETQTPRIEHHAARLRLLARGRGSSSRRYFVRMPSVYAPSKRIF